jgi:hypothetical protein
MTDGEMSRLPRVGVICGGVLKEVPNPEKLDLKTLESLVGANTGNLAFTYPIDVLIDNPVERIPWDFDIKTARQRYDVLWFACANMIGSHCDLGWVSDHLEKADLPVIAVGLGAQTQSIRSHDLKINPGTLRWLLTLERLSPSSCNIFCRGSYTDSMLKRVQVGFSTAGCCPSLFISSDASLGQSIATRALSPEHAKKPLAVYSGFIGNQSLYPLEQSLVHLLEQDGDPGIYISQHGGTLLSLGDERFRGQLSESELLHAKTMIKPQTSMEDFLHWCKIHARSFFSVDEWLRVLQHYSYSCGMRFHGNMLSLQAGIPSVCITIDSRTEELCQSCLVPSMTAFEFSHVTREVLHRVFRVRFNPDEFDFNRVMMARKLMSFLLANNVSPSLHLQTIATGQTASSALVEVDKRAPALV